MNKEQHIKYWLDLAVEDLDTAKYNLSGKKHLAALFFFHLSIEKLLKAHWVKSNVSNTPPFTHDLEVLSAETSLNFTADQYDYLGSMSNWNIELRYPDYRLRLHHLADKVYMEHHLLKIEALFAWLLSQL